VQPTTRVVRIAPGEKDLKNATPVQLQDVQVGDRILVGGKLSEDNLSLAASSVVVMKRSDLQARDQQNLQDWQKRGVDGAGQCRWMQPLGLSPCLCEAGTLLFTPRVPLSFAATHPTR